MNMSTSNTTTEVMPRLPHARSARRYGIRCLSTSRSNQPVLTRMPAPSAFTALPAKGLTRTERVSFEHLAGKPSHRLDGTGRPVSGPSGKSLPAGAPATLSSAPSGPHALRPSEPSEILLLPTLPLWAPRRPSPPHTRRPLLSGKPYLSQWARSTGLAPSPLPARELTHTEPRAL